MLGVHLRWYATSCGTASADHLPRPNHPISVPAYHTPNMHFDEKIRLLCLACGRIFKSPSLDTASMPATCKARAIGPKASGFRHAWKLTYLIVSVTHCTDVYCDCSLLEERRHIALRQRGSI